MLGFVLSCHKMDDNYGQHTCDSLASTGSPCVKQKFTIHNLLDLSEMATITKLLFFHMFLRPTTNLLAYHDEGHLHKRSESEKVPGETITNAYLNIFSILVRCHDLYHKMGNVCGNGLLGDMLNERAKLHWQPLFILCER